MSPEPTTARPGDALDARLQNDEPLLRKVIALDSGEQLAAAVVRTGERLRLHLLTDAAAPLFLHWGTMKRRHARWKLPAAEFRPEETTDFDEIAAQSPFSESGGLRELCWEIPAEQAPRSIGFVLHGKDPERWLKHHHRNMELRIAPPAEGEAPLDGLSERIVEGEMGHHGWTLMHRFNLCHELIDDAGDAREAWATLFVWLRYSAVRQLDWQRNYNTKPRELSHAQDRLTARLATAYVELPRQRDLIRLMLGCLGRGGDGQRIRDEILHIMHRHHIKEVGGTWMEQWHQKLHNNTTPDDIVICEAYLAFLHAGGDLKAYHRTLAEGGVTEERLAGLERPINTEPEWHPHLRDGLLHDFGHYLVLLKSVHSGTDLATAIDAGGHLLDEETRGSLHWVRDHFAHPHTPLLDLVHAITGIRTALHGRLGGEADEGVVKELIYLDLALEQALRTAIERHTQDQIGGGELFELIGLVTGHLLLGDSGEEELVQCRREWLRLPDEDRFSSDWALHAKAALDRLRRSVEGRIDTAYQLLQPIAERLGKRFEADEWVIRLFSEEIVRGQDVFLLSMLVHHFDPVLRRQARLGDWQVISPSTAVGEVRVVESFRSVQGKSFDRPTIIVADKVHGDEEPPEGVRAVITPSSVDLVSHVAVRARNNHLLFATCYDPLTFDELRKSKGKVIELRVGPAGDVIPGEAPAGDSPTVPARASSMAEAPPVTPSLEVLGLADFDRARVGGKSWHLKELASKLPDWVDTPRSIALPFGVFDAVLAEPANRRVAERYRSLVGGIPDSPEAKLAEVRACVLELALPDALLGDIESSMAAAGLAPPADRDKAATRIKQVWASKWNDRAYFSRTARGFPHQAMHMAVLIQELVEAEFAYVIHTVNPFNGSPDEIYAELVLGLGETLVGNYPGRAMSFVAPKQGGAPTLLAYPAKSVGLFGSGLIFRSDSNAEDLEGYAGAGLYDSVLLEEPEERVLDYTDQPLVWEPGLRSGLLEQVARVGEVVERAFGSPQDIEGAYRDGKFAVVQTRPQVGL